MRLNVLALSYLFPNSAQPAYGIFVLNRLKAVRGYCDVKVVAPVQRYPLMSRLRGAMWGKDIPHYEKIGDLDVYHPRFFVIPRYFKWIDAITYWWSARAVTKNLQSKVGFDFDVVDVHWTYPDVVAGYFLARAAGKKFIVTVRGHEALYDEEISLRRWLVAHFLRQADVVVTLSAELREKVVTLGVAREKTRIVLNGVDQSHFYPMDRKVCRKHLGLPADHKIILSVGRVTRGKGHQDLIRVIPELSKSENTELYIIGGVNPEDDFTQDLHKMIAGLGLKNVHLMDKIPHEKLPMWYSAADLFCLLSRREGCPNALLEALACGTPAVVTDVGAVTEMMVQGENGFVVGRDELASLAEILRTSLNHEWNRESIAARMNGWGWSARAEQIFRIYRSVLAQG